MKIADFWVVAPCSLVEVYQRFRGPCCLQQGRTDSTGSQPTDESRIHFREAWFGRLPALRRHDVQPHQQAAIQAQHQVCGPTP
jgi:hypothetical protein